MSGMDREKKGEMEKERTEMGRKMERREGVKALPLLVKVTPMALRPWRP